MPGILLGRANVADEKERFLCWTRATFTEQNADTYEYIIRSSESADEKERTHATFIVSNKNKMPGGGGSTRATEYDKLYRPPKL